MGEVSLQGFHPLEDGMRPFEGWRPLEALGLAILEGEGDGNSPIDMFRLKPFTLLPFHSAAAPRRIGATP
jgi:hypothetical protein